MSPWQNGCTLYRDERLTWLTVLEAKGISIVWLRVLYDSVSDGIGSTFCESGERAGETRLSMCR